MQLQLDPPDTVQAEHNLEFAARELSLTGTNNVDVLRNKAARAQARFLAGDPLEAENLLSELLTAGASQSPHITADAHALQGQIAAARGDVASARSYFLRAVQVLSGIGADRGAGQLWLDLAALLESVGELDIARDAYRSAAVATGLTVRAIAATPVRLAQR
jgi:tetratricopeptide (TPR) repeat protein